MRACSLSVSLALSVEVGLGVLRELLELEVDELVGPKGMWNWELCLRWTAAGMLEAESRFRNVQGRPRPRQPRSRDRTRPTPSPSECHSHPNRGGRRSTHCVTMTPGTAVTKVQRRTEQPRDS